MNRTPSQTARILGVEIQQVKRWAWLFKEHLSQLANPPKGRSRAFTDQDVLALAHVALHWEDNPDIEAIGIGLNQQEFYHDEKGWEILYLHTPILQEPPDDLDETWRHGVFLNGGGVGEYLELARSYRQGAEALLDSALNSGEPRDWGYPVLFAYRHALELYLKIIGDIKEPTHSLKTCVGQVEKRHRNRIGSPIREWILEFDKIDPSGTTFRYADDEGRTLSYADDEGRTLSYAEFWIDFAQLKFAMARVFQTVDQTILWWERQESHRP